MGLNDPQKRSSEKLKSLGWVKRSLDQEKLKKLYMNGIFIPGFPNPVFMSF